MPYRTLKDTHLVVCVCVFLLWNGNVAFTSQAYPLSLANLQI